MSFILDLDKHLDEELTELLGDTFRSEPEPLMRARWKKLRSGAWGVHVFGHPASGDTVAITKANGEEQTAVVDVVLWSGADRRERPISICSVVPTRRGSNG